jgi:hypothetical protein
MMMMIYSKEIIMKTIIQYSIEEMIMKIKRINRKTKKKRKKKKQIKIKKKNYFSIKKIF